MSSMPPLWAQVNEDGFGHPLNTAYDEAALFSFDGHLYANTEYGILRLSNPRTKRWATVPVPQRILKRPVPLGCHLYLQADAGAHLWRAAAGALITQASWTPLTSLNLPTHAHPHLMTIFKDRLYGILWTVDPKTKNPVFEIWRSGALTWESVVLNSFGDPTNNTGPGVMGVYLGKLFAGTKTLRDPFGGPQPGSGVEIWETTSGDPGSWTQVNQDGFGTVNYAGMRTNHLIGSWAIYRAPTDPQDYLYLGTKTHWGAEVWRYDGTGLSGWTNVTQDWGGVDTGPGRIESMVVFDDLLYVAEGYPTGNLGTFNGATWQIAVPGPVQYGQFTEEREYPFDPMNSGVISLAVIDGLLFAHTLHKPNVGSTKGDQVWAYPYLFA